MILLLLLSQMGAATDEGPYFAHGDIKHGHGGDFLVQQYLQNINNKQEVTITTATEPEPGAATEEGPILPMKT